MYSKYTVGYIHKHTSNSTNNTRKKQEQMEDEERPRKRFREVLEDARGKQRDWISSTSSAQLVQIPHLLISIFACIGFSLRADTKNANHLRRVCKHWDSLILHCIITGDIKVPSFEQGARGRIAPSLLWRSLPSWIEQFPLGDATEYTAETMPPTHIQEAISCMVHSESIPSHVFPSTQLSAEMRRLSYQAQYKFANPFGFKCVYCGVRCRTTSDMCGGCNTKSLHHCETCRFTAINDTLTRCTVCRRVTCQSCSGSCIGSHAGCCAHCKSVSCGQGWPNSCTNSVCVCTAYPSAHCSSCGRSACYDHRVYDHSNSWRCCGCARDRHVDKITLLRERRSMVGVLIAKDGSDHPPIQLEPCSPELCKRFDRNNRPDHFHVSPLDQERVAKFRPAAISRGSSNPVHQVNSNKWIIKGERVWEVVGCFGRTQRIAIDSKGNAYTYQEWVNTQGKAPPDERVLLLDLSPGPHLVRGEDGSLLGTTRVDTRWREV